MLQNFDMRFDLTMIILSRAHAVLFLSVAKILFCRKTLVNRQIERGRNSRAFC